MPLWLASAYTLKGIWAAIIAGVIALLLAANIAQAVNTYADIRIPLPFGLHIGWEGWKPKSERIQRDFDKYKDDVKKASAANAAAQAKLIADQKARFDASAEKSNANYQVQLADARSASERYLATHRVQPAASASVSAGPATQESHDPAVPQEATAAAVVYISEPDYHASVDDYAYAKACYDWGQDSVSKGVAEFKEP